MGEITWIQLIVMSLAVFRLTRLIVYDQITEFLRSPFLMEYEETDEEGNIDVYMVPKERGILGWLGQLISCYWCTGVWATLIIFFLQWIPKIGSVITIILAIAGLAAIVETIIQKMISDE